MGDPLLAAMNISGLMDNDFTDFLTHDTQKIQLKLEEAGPKILPGGDSYFNNDKENNIPENQLEARNNGPASPRKIASIQLPAFMKATTRTIKLRNPALKLIPQLPQIGNSSRQPVLVTTKYTNEAKPRPRSQISMDKDKSQSQSSSDFSQQSDNSHPSKRVRAEEEENEEEFKPASFSGITPATQLTSAEHAAKLLKFNEAESCKNLAFYGLVPGTIKMLLKGALVKTFSVQILSVKNRRVKISDGRDVTDKCFIAPEMKNITFLSNPIINVLEWSLVNLTLSSTKSETVIKISKFAIKENSKDFPVLGDPNKGHTSWSSIICFLDHLNLNPVHENVDLLTERWAKIISTKMMAAMGYWHCVDCKHYKSRQQRHMVNHIQISHLSNFPGYKCKDCGKILPSTGEVERHLKSEHSGGLQPSHNAVKEVPKKVAYRCPVIQCQLRLDSREQFDIHIKTVHHLSLKFRDDVEFPQANQIAQTLPQTTNKSLEETKKSIQILKPIASSPGQGKYDISSLEKSPENITNLAANILGSMDTHFLTAEEAEETFNQLEKDRVEEDAAKKNNNLKDVTDHNLVKVARKTTIEKSNWDEEIDCRIMRAGVLFQCTECGYNKMKEDLMIDHVQGRHLPQFPGYECPSCNDKFPTLVPFLVHMKMAHKSSPNELERSQCVFRQVPVPKSWEQSLGLGENKFAEHGDDIIV